MDSTSQPLISCVMPTTARRRLFVPQAIRYFQRQDYANKELLIVDDGPESVAEVVPDDPQVRYLRLSGERSLGMKRNLCVEAARGDLIMHWDDDDWASPQRISYQAGALKDAHADICGIRQMIFYELATGLAWLYVYPPDQRPWLAGNSLLYTREFWRRSPFPDIQVASDTRFVWSQTLEHSVALSDYTFYVAMIHPDNTSPKNHQGSYWSRWNGSVQSIMGADFAFYQRFLMDAEQEQQLPPSESVRPASSNEPVQETSAQLKPAVTVAVRTPAEQNRETAGRIGQPATLSGAQPESQTVLTAGQPGFASTRARARRPAVSCILATGNRPGFTRQAIRCFLRQTIDDSELIVVDDGRESVAALCAGLFRVRHLRLDEPTTPGRKLNIGIEQAAGSVIQKLGDDDFYHQDFLSRSTAALRAANDERAVVAWDCFAILLAGESCARYSGHGWTTGGPLCFHRSLWEQHPFRDEPRQADTFFIEDNDARLAKICAPELYMLVRQSGNTHADNGSHGDDRFKLLPPYTKSLDELIEPIDRPFYHSLLREDDR